MIDARPRLFVSIAAYRDRDCPNTIADMFAKARHPERLFIGLCWQFIKPDDEDCDPVGPRPQQCRVIALDATGARGVCWARAQVQSLWRGEEYTLQIDSHMRFVQDWDEKLLAMLAACPSPRPILSNYPAAFTPPDRIDSHVVSVIYAAGFDHDGMVKQNSIGHAPETMGPIPQPAGFCAGGFLFGDSRWINEVPYDPYLYFLGEETTLAVRLYTHGWDIFTPTDVLVYHDYNSGPERPRHWIDQPDWVRLNERSLKRVRHLLAIETSKDPEVLAEIDRFGLGKIRTLVDYQRFAEIEFAARRLYGRSAAELDSLAPTDQKRRRNAELFGAIWRQNSWGAAETHSGPGSTLDATYHLRQQLAELCRFLGIARLVDAGCGDLNWMAEISGQFELYLGLDVVSDLIVDLDRRFGARRGHFFAVRDITLDGLPKACAILCRDVMTHLPEAEVVQALSHVKASGSRYLIATTHATGSNKPIALGDWQPIDLTAAPFSLPPPFVTLQEQPDSPKSLGVWQIDRLTG